MRRWHTVLQISQDALLDAVIRRRIRGLRLVRGWSLDALAAWCHLSASTLSRLETGHRRISLEAPLPIARALGTTIDELVDTVDDDDVVIRPRRDETRAMTLWSLSGDRAPHGVAVAKMRIRPTPPVPHDQMGVHPGREWFTVLSGTARLQLGDRTIEVAAGDAAEFSTMTPHAIGCDDEPVEILTILDRAGERAHLHTT